MPQDVLEFGPGTYLDPKVAAVLAVPRRQTVSEWAAENRELQTKDSAEPGPWSNLRAPYLTAIMDAFSDPEITDVVIMKAAQVGMSEAMRNVLGYWIANDPGAALWVMPDDKSAQEALAERLAPMIRSTPALAVHVTDRAHDIGRYKILLDHMEIHAAWATSPQSLASRPKRFVINDEVDKYPAWSGNESNPVALGKKRRTTFGHRSKGAELSTPTTRNGPIWKSFEACPVRQRFHVPCPHCGEFAAMTWSSVRWPQVEGTRAEQASQIEEGSLAWYHCERCAARIDEPQRDAMVARGVWAADDCETVARDGTIQGKRPASRTIAFHISALISPWVSWSQMAAEFLRAIGDESLMMDFRNSRLGEPYEIRTGGVRSDAFDSLIAAGHRPGVVPTWAIALLATADTQKDHFWWTVRAWGDGSRSRLIAYGQCDTFDELRMHAFGTKHQNEDPAQRPMSAMMLGIDSGGGGDIDSDMSRTHQVYQFALSDPSRIVATKGWGGAKELETPIRQAFATLKPGAGQVGPQVALYHLKTGYFKDILAARIAGEDGADPWEVHEAIDETYRRQMASEHKVIMRRGKAQVARWVTVAAGGANHLWDCEVIQTALAQIAHLDAPRPPKRQYGAIKRL